MRLQFVMSEVAIGLRRNLVMSIAMIITTAISLSLLGAGWLIRDKVEQMKDFYYKRVEVSIFLDKNVTQSQRDQLRRQLEGTPQVRSVLYESQEEAYERFREQFKDSPNLVKNISADALPESFRVKLKDPTKFEVVASQFDGAAGVDKVVDQRKILDKLFSVLSGLGRAAVAISVAQIVAAVLLISNTIQVAAFSRRRETGIMRLVGASRWYIQLPFILEAALAGCVGALVAAGLLFVGKWTLLDGPLGSVFQPDGTIPAITYVDIVKVSAALTGVGVLLAALAALVTLWRYLRV